MIAKRPHTMWEQQQQICFIDVINMFIVQRAKEFVNLKYCLQLWLWLFCFQGRNHRGTSSTCAVKYLFEKECQPACLPNTKVTKQIGFLPNITEQIKCEYFWIKKNNEIQLCPYLIKGFVFLCQRYIYIPNGEWYYHKKKNTFS